MKNTYIIISFFILSAFSVKAQIHSRNKLINNLYEIELQKDASLNITLKGGNEKKYRFSPAFTVMRRDENPKLISQNAHRVVPGFKGAVSVPMWVEPHSKEVVADFFQAAIPVSLVAYSAEISQNQINWTFAANPSFEIKASCFFQQGINEPVIKYNFLPKKAGWYSVGYTGSPEVNPNDMDAVWQPYIWQEKRFPQQSFLSSEDMCSLPSAMVEKDGYTFGVIAEPHDIPFELPSMSQGNVRFGVLVRNHKGNAQPMIFAPLLGTKESNLPVNKLYSFQLRLLLYKGKQPDAFRYVAEKLFGFKDYRKNVFLNLNQTIENTIDFAMNDMYCGWNADLRGFDYSTDVQKTVKVVSALHPLSISVVTDNESIYQRRALPMTEFLMSRQRYLFTIDKTVTRQNASSKMAGPGMEVSELAALNDYYQDRSPVFRYYADSLSRISRSLNLNTTSRGDAWPNLLALYRMNGDPAVLEKSKSKADEYIKSRILQKAKDFSTTEQAAQFWTDFAPSWIELLDLYEETKEKRYLDAAVDGAKLYMEYVWFYPVIPDKNITVNKGGMVAFRCYEAVRDSMPNMPAPEQSVPGWRLSQIGLTPEASNTFASNPAIFLTHYASHLLRLAYYTSDDFFRSVARSAVIGRYANYPGYDINGIFNTVYSRPDYPLRPFNQISYNQVYYNHVWPQIALLFDYLVSDVYALSKGKINFPGQYAQGYAYLKSKVYGDRPGIFYGDDSVYLWMPKQLLAIDNVQLNYLTGYGNGKFYMVLLNQSDQPVKANVSFNPDLVPVKAGNSLRIWEQNQSPHVSALTDGKLHVAVAAKGITAIAIDDIKIVTQFQQKIYDKEDKRLSDHSYKKIRSSFGNISSAIYSLGKLNSSHTWLEASGEQLNKATIHYRVGGSEKSEEMEDSSYPFEFTIPLPAKEQGLELWIEGTTPEGKMLKSDEIILKK